MMDFEVLVFPKPEVLDPECRAIKSTLVARGFESITSIHVSKRFVVSLASDAQDPDRMIQEIAESYLANPVSQAYAIKRLSP